MPHKEGSPEKGYLFVLMSSPKKRPYGKLDLAPPELPLAYLGFLCQDGDCGNGYW